jgi:hypothetical protein
VSLGQREGSLWPYSRFSRPGRPLKNFLSLKHLQNHGVSLRTLCTIKPRNSIVDTCTLRHELRRTYKYDGPISQLGWMDIFYYGSSGKTKQLECDDIQVYFSLQRLIIQPFLAFEKCYAVCFAYCLSFMLWRNVRSCFHFEQCLWILYLAYFLCVIRKVGVYMISYVCACVSASSNNIWAPWQDLSSPVRGWHSCFLLGGPGFSYRPEGLPSWEAFCCIS